MNKYVTGVLSIVVLAPVLLPITLIVGAVSAVCWVTTQAVLTIEKVHGVVTRTRKEPK